MPSSQNGIGPYSQTLTPRGFQQVDLSAGGVGTLTRPAGVAPNTPLIVLVQATVGAARYRFDGTAPTTAIGNILTQNNTMLIVPDPAIFANLKFRRDGTDATILAVQYFSYATVSEE